MDKFDRALEGSQPKVSIVPIPLNFREVHQIGLLCMTPLQSYKSTALMLGRSRDYLESPYYQSYMTIHDNFFRAGGSADVELTGNFTRLVTDPDFRLPGGEIEL